MKRTVFCSATRALAVLLLFYISGAKGAPVITLTPIVLAGQNVPGVGTIQNGFQACVNMSVNDGGGWLVQSDTNPGDPNTDELILRGTGPYAGTLLLREGQAVILPAGAAIDSFDSVNINNAGNRSFNHYLSGTGTFLDPAVYFNDALLIQRGTFSTAVGFSANTSYVGLHETHINNSNQILMIASVDDPAIASTTDRALIRIDNPSGAFTETVIAKEGDQLFPGRFITDFGLGPHASDINDSGHVIFLADVDGATTDDAAVVVYNGNGFIIKAREGDPCPAVPGRNWLNLASVSVAMNNNGDWAILAALNAPTTDDWVIVKNGTQLIAREGSSLPAIGGVFTFTAFGIGNVPYIGLDDDGNVFWFADWNNPDTSRDSGIFRNDQLIVQEGVTLVDGSFVQYIFGAQHNFGISDNGRWLIFDGILNLDRHGAILVEMVDASGDLNCDTQINGNDIGAFALAVIDPTLYGTTYVGCPIGNGDFNGDSTTNAADITDFVEAVLGQ